jgi:hypothetical protein
VDEHLVVLLEPGVQPVPVEGQIPLDVGALGQGVLVAPDGVADEHEPSTCRKGR